MKTSAWTGWIAFAGWMMLIIAMLDFFEGLIAVIRSEYYVLGPNQIIVFDTTTSAGLRSSGASSSALPASVSSQDRAGHAGSRSWLAASTSSRSSASSAARSTPCGR